MIQDLTPEEVNQLYTFRNSVAQFRVLLDTLPAGERSMEHNKQYNELRSEAQALLKSPFTENVPRAITGNTNTDRAISAIVVVGALLALVGFGLNSIIPEDLLLYYSLGCCLSSGGLLLVIGAFMVLTMKNVRERVTSVEDLKYLVDLLLYQADHRLAMVGQRAAPPQPPVSAPMAAPPPNLAPPE